MEDHIRVSVVTPCFRGEAYLERFLASVEGQSMLAELEVILDHNEPSRRELELVRDFQRRHPGRVVHLVTDPVQPIGASMNSCVRRARGDYLTIWNVDDLRTSDSILRQTEALDRAPEAGFTYGDYVNVQRFGSTEGLRVHPPTFDRHDFTRSMHLGPFFAWRRELVDQAGLFDEQLRSGADFDLAVRLAFNADGVRSEGLLGYYLDAGLGASTRPDSLQAVERTVIELRYGAFDKIDWQLLGAARGYRAEALLEGDTWHQVSLFVPEYDDLLARSQPLWAISRRRHRQNVRTARRAVLRRTVGRLHRAPAAVLRRIRRLTTRDALTPT